MLRLDGLKIARGDFHLSADFTVKPGARVAVIGPSGAGKSTLLNAIAGFEPLSAGRITLNDADLTPLPPGKRPVAMLFQDNNLFLHLDLAQNVSLGIDPNLRLSTDQKAKVANALDRVGLQGLHSRKPGQVSGGQQARAAIARLLVQSRPVLLLDEPFAALGPALKADMLDLVADLTRQTGATLLMVTHDPAEAARLCDKAVLVADGTAHGPQPTGVLLRDPPPALRAYLGESLAVPPEKPDEQQ